MGNFFPFLANFKKYFHDYKLYQLLLVFGYPEFATTFDSE